MNVSKVLKVDHIGVAVNNIEESLELYSAVLGLQPIGTEIVEEQKVKVAFLPVGDTEIELLEATEPDSPVAKFIESRGQGVQHIAFRVENIDLAIAEMKAKGMRLIDAAPRYGAGNAKIAFMHPKSTNGVLIELCER
ncbi:MAG: methylmalonyl-CoA epimerase [Oscillospiraceae bacterium]|nr:methylmalonyl-CoA epimerase [Oscillospiraceae bacterium]